jgi:hypothetical protein
MEGDEQRNKDPDSSIFIAIKIENKNPREGPEIRAIKRMLY